MGNGISLSLIGGIYKKKKKCRYEISFVTFACGLLCECDGITSELFNFVSDYLCVRLALLFWDYAFPTHTETNHRWD